LIINTCKCLYVCMFVDLKIIFKYFAALFFIFGWEGEKSVNKSKGDT